MSSDVTGGPADKHVPQRNLCPIGNAMDVVGTRSAMLIMREAYYGTTRFDDFFEQVGITEAVAATRLRKLTDEGLLERTPYREPGQRTRYEYQLTDKGRDLIPVVIALYEWGTKYTKTGRRAPARITHAKCAAPVHVEMRCDDGHEVPLTELSVVPLVPRGRARTA